jgi:DNA polymerase zeta
VEPADAEISKGDSGDLQSSPMLPLTPEGRASLITARAVQPSRAFDTCKAVNANRYVYSPRAPTVSELKDQLQKLGLPSKIYQAPYYSKDCDIPEASKEYAGLTYRLEGGQGISWLEEWSTNLPAISVPKSDQKIELNHIGIGGWEYAGHPPSVKELRRSLDTFLSAPNDLGQKARSQVKGRSRLCRKV